MDIRLAPTEVERRGARDEHRDEKRIALVAEIYINDERDLTGKSFSNLCGKTAMSVVCY